MTEQIPINQAATEQRLVEELTGSTPPVQEPTGPDTAEPGDPEPATTAQTNDHQPPAD